MNTQVKPIFDARRSLQGSAALVPRVRRGLQTSAILISVAAALAACGGGGTSDSAASTESAQDSASPATNSAQPQIIPASATFEGKTYPQWSAASWQWALALPAPTPPPPYSSSNLPHPFVDCNIRPISASQSGDVWYWTAPSGTQTCDQSATVIPAGKAIFLAVIDVEASSLDARPFQSDTAAGQQAIAQFWADHIVNVFCSIDGVPVTNVQTFRFLTQQFQFQAPTPWIFGSAGGTGTSVADGYYLMLQLPSGPHTIHYGGTFHFDKGERGPGPVHFTKSADFPVDVTLKLTAGPTLGG